MNGLINEAFNALKKELLQVNCNLAVDTLRPLDKQGVLNFLFYCAQHNGRPCVIRLSLNPRRSGYRYFDKELWVSSQLRSHGIPVPEILSPIYEFPFHENKTGAFYVAEYIKGIPATENSTVAYQHLGETMRNVHQINCVGYGSHFVADPAHFPNSWPEAIDEDSKKYGSTIESLTKELSSAEIDCYEKRRKHLAALNFQGKLCHGDINLHNLLLNPNDLSVAALLDWERALSTLVPHSALMMIAYERLILGASYSPEDCTAIFQRDGIIPEVRDFLRGYGISVVEYKNTCRSYTETLLLSKMLPFFSWWHQTTEVNEKKTWEKTYLQNRALLHQLLAE